MPGLNRELGMRPYSLIPSVLLQYKPDGLTKRANDMNCSYSGSYVERVGLTQKKPPASSRGLLLKQQVLSLPADLEGGSTTQAEGTAVRGDHLDPECILVLEVGSFAGLAQRIQARLLRARGRCVEARQLED